MNPDVLRTLPAKEICQSLLPPHLSDQARAGFDRAVSEGDTEMAREFCSPKNMMSAKAQAYSKAACELLQKSGRVVVVGNADHGTATAALNEMHLVARAFRGVLLKFKAVRIALWTR